MFIKSLSSICNWGLISNNTKPFNSQNDKNNTSSLENVIDGFNDVKSKINVATQKRGQVFINF